MTSATSSDSLIPVDAPSAGGLSIASIIALVKRHKTFLLVWVVVGTVAGGAAIFNLRLAYQATAEVVLDSRVQRPNDYASVMSGPFTLTDYTPVIRSETQVLQSPALAARVIDGLGLARIPEFQPNDGLRARATAFMLDLAVRYLPKPISDMVTAGPDTVPDADTQRALLVEGYLRRLSVSNDGRSLTITVKVWARDPKLAAEIANAHVRLYIADQSALKELTARHAADWIGTQVERLGSDLRAEEDASREFRENAGLVRAQGSTVVAQQVAQINDQLSRARAELAQRESMVAQVEDGSASSAGVQSPVLNSLLIQHLRQQESELTTVLLKLQSRYKGVNPVVETALAQVNGVRTQIAQETARIVGSLKAEAAMARVRFDVLSKRMNEVQSQLVGEDRSDVQAGAMERDIAAKGGVYRDLMSRQQQIAAQIGAEQADARIISMASVPRVPFYPNKPLFMALALVMVSTSGLGLASLLERSRKGIDRLDEISGAAGIMQFHSVPTVPDAQLNGLRLTDYLLDKPMAEFADCIRSLRGDIMHSRRSPGPRILALTSTVPGEGKTTMAVSIARSMATADLSVLLIDGDLRRSRCADRVGASPSRKGLVGMLRGKVALEDAVISDPRSTVKLLVAEQRPVSPQDLLDTPMLQRILDEAKAQYDFIILDTPPITGFADAWLIAQQADAVVLAVRWQSTPAVAVAEAIRAFSKRRVQLTGLFLNDVNLSKSARNQGKSEIYEAIKSYYSNV